MGIALSVSWMSCKGCIKDLRLILTYFVFSNWPEVEIFSPQNRSPGDQKVLASDRPMIYKELNPLDPLSHLR
jgi:hypothetical protein